MRTLKKTLCLVLVLAMMVGLCAFSAFAMDFTDADKIQHTDAVAALTGMGVIKGNADGSFNPEGTLTRAEAAVILVRMLGMDDIKATSSFTDLDAVKAWAGDAIAVCEAESIVAGVGGGKFDPNGKLTGSAWGKMLLKAVGYEDPDLDDAQKWEIAVAKGLKATKPIALKEGLDSFDGTAPISRDDAAQMAFNGLWVSPSGTTTDAYVVTDGLGNVVYEGDDSMLAVGALVSAGAGASVTKKTISVGSLGADNFGLKEETATDEFGRTSTEYTNGKTGAAKIVYGTVGETAKKTYTASKKLGEIAADLGATVSKTVKLTVIEDGVKGAAKDVNKTDTTAIGGRGTLIEVYANNEGGYNVIVINTYVAKLAKTDVHAAKAATSTTDAVAAYIDLPDGLTYNTSAFAAGDVILFNKGVLGGAPVAANVAKAPSITGSVTAVASSYVRIDNAVKYQSKNKDASVGTFDAGLLAIDGSVNTYYLDNYGNLIFAEAGKAAQVETKYLYLIDTASKAAKSGEGDNLFETSETAGAKAQAKIIDLTTGEIKVVNLGIVKNASGYFYADKTGAASSEKVTDTKPVPATTAPDGLYEYFELASGEIVLGEKAAVESFTAKKGTADADAKYIATSSTKLTTVTLNTNKAGAITSASVTTLTGIANFPATATTYSNAIVVANGTTKVASSIVAVTKKGPAITAPSYAIYSGKGEKDADGQKYAFYVNGSRVQYYSVALSGLTKGDVVTVKLTDGKIANASDVKKLAADATGTVAVVDETFLTIGSTAYYFADGCEAYDAETFAKATIAAGDDVALYLDDDGNIAFALVG